MSSSDDTAPTPPPPVVANDLSSMHVEASGSDDTSRFLPPSLHTGIAEIDAQHAMLFRRLVWLKRQCLQNNYLPADDAEGLLAYLQEHFSTEERLASEANMDFSSHADRHRTMINDVARALHSAVAGQADIFGVLRYIEYWFERHIVHEDMRLAALCSIRDANRNSVHAAASRPSPGIGA